MAICPLDKWIVPGEEQGLYGWVRSGDAVLVPINLLLSPLWRNQRWHFFVASGGRAVLTPQAREAVCLREISCLALYKTSHCPPLRLNLGHFQIRKPWQAPPVSFIFISLLTPRPITGQGWGTGRGECSFLAGRQIVTMAAWVCVWSANNRAYGCRQYLRIILMENDTHQKWGLSRDPMEG